jgi:SRSO17 transposase
MSNDMESRFEAYCQGIVEAMGHADRHRPARWYLKGLMLPGERKSVEPMAARVCPHEVRSAHQSMHHVVADADWDDSAVLAAVARQVVPALMKKRERPWWILDDTGHAKKGRHSVGVARQYCGRWGKTDNCQVAVSLSVATDQGSLPLAYQLYLPSEWAEDRPRCARAGVPQEIGFRTKGEIARRQIEAALSQGLPPGIVLADAAYGVEAAFRDWLTEQSLDYVLAVRETTTVWWDTHQPAKTVAAKRGRPRIRLKRDSQHAPISVFDVAKQAAKTKWRRVTWREGAQGALSSRFMRVRVVAAHGDRARAPQWLLIEWLNAEEKPAHYWLSTLPETISLKALVAHAKGRWRIERDYQELKSELGLSHYEGRNWRGFHHHATLCIAALGFLTLERLRGKKNSARFKAPPVPRTFRPRGSRSDATSPPRVDRKPAFSPRAPDRAHAASLSVLRRATREGNMNYFLTQ